MPLVESPGVKAFVELAYRLLALVNIKLLFIVEQKASIPAVNSVRLIAEEKVIAFIAVFA